MSFQPSSSLRVFRVEFLAALLVTVCAFGTSCGEEEVLFQRYYDVPGQEWSDYLNSIGIQEETEGAVLLVMHGSQCASCLKELSWWNDQYISGSEENIFLIVIEQYEVTYNQILKQQGIKIPAYRDSTASVLRRELIPTTPVKLLFDNNHEIKSMNYIGTNGDLPGFIDQLNSI